MLKSTLEKGTPPPVVWLGQISALQTSTDEITRKYKWTYKQIQMKI